MAAKTSKKGSYQSKTTYQKRVPTIPPEDRFPFVKENYLIMIIGLVVIAVGYLLMVGGGSSNPNEFYPDKIYSWRRITLAPIVIIIGFLVEVYAIMKRPKQEVHHHDQDKSLK